MANETQLSVAVDGNNQVAVIESKGPLDLKASRVVIPFAAVDVIYHQILAHRIQRAQRDAATATQAIAAATEADLHELEKRKSQFN